MKTNNENPHEENKTSENQHTDTSEVPENPGHKKIRLTTMLPPSPGLMSPVRLILLFTVFALAIYIFFSASPVSNEGEVIFRGIKSIEEITIRRLDQKITLVKTGKIWKLKTGNYKLPIKKDRIRKFLKILKNLKGERIKFNGHAELKGGYKIITKAGIHEIKIFRSYKNLLLQYKDKTWKLFLNNEDLLLPSRRSLIIRKLIKTDKKNISRMILPVMTVGGIKKYVFHKQKNMWVLGIKHIHYVKNSFINDVIAKLNGLSYKRLIPPAELRGKPYFQIQTLKRQSVSIYKIKGSCPPGETALQIKTSGFNVAVCTDTGAFKQLIRPLPEILEQRLIPLSEVLWNNIRIKTETSSFTLKKINEKWEIIQNGNNEKADELSVEKWINLWMKNPVIRIKKTTETDNFNIVITFNGSKKKDKKEEVTWILKLNVSKPNPNGPPPSPVVLKRMNEDMLLEVSSVFASDIYSPDYFKSKKIFPDLTPGGFIRKGLGTTEEFTVSDEKLLVVRPADTKIDISGAEYLFKTLKNLRAVKFIKKSNPDPRPRILSIENKTANPYQPHAPVEITMFYGNKKSVTIFIEPDKNEGFDNKRRFTLKKEDHKTLLEALGEPNIVKKNLADTVNLIKYGNLTDNVSLKRISDYWVFKGKINKITDLKTVAEYLKTAKAIINNANPVYYGKLKTDEYLYFYSDFAVPLKFRILESQDKTLISLENYNVIYATKTGTELLKLFKIKTLPDTEKSLAKTQVK